jgi:FkbM family methyltransferase
MTRFPALRAIVRNWIVRTAQRMPEGILLDLVSRLSMRRRLDYAGHELFLNITSPDEYFIRAYSCRKEPETVRWIESSARMGDVFYDIGANVGAYTLIASKVARSTLKVYAFEPAFGNFAQLCSNIQDNGSGNNVIPLPVALSDANGFAPLMLGSLKSGKSAHLAEENGASESADPEIRQVVPAWRLDDLVKCLGMEMPNLIKIDVDGAEPEVLGGAVDTLRHPALRAIQIELDTDEETKKNKMVHQILGAAGFVRQARHVHTIYANYLFVRP